jgi:hypothetical protein
LLEAGALTVMAGVTVVCLPMVWAKLVVRYREKAKPDEGTDSLD